MNATTTDKTIQEVIDSRRATPHFKKENISDSDLARIIEAGRQAPSGYNLQPWRFVIVREDDKKQKLQKAVMDQPKVGEASAVIVACGDPEAWEKGDLDEMLSLAREHGFGNDEQHEKMRKTIRGFLGKEAGDAGGLAPDKSVWVNRHVMIAFTHMMLMAESIGYDTAPMEGFYESKVRETLGIPDGVRVIAVLAIGRRSGDDKPYGGRFDTAKIAFSERWGVSYKPRS